MTSAKMMRRTVAAMNAEQDRLVALLLGQTGGGQADDDGVVAGEHQVDADDHQEGDDLGSEKLREIKHAVPHMSVWGQRMRNAQRDASGTGMVAKSFGHGAEMQAKPSF